MWRLRAFLEVRVHVRAAGGARAGLRRLRAGPVDSDHLHLLVAVSAVGKVRHLGV